MTKEKIIQKLKGIVNDRSNSKKLIYFFDGTYRLVDGQLLEINEAYAEELIRLNPDIPVNVFLKDNRTFNGLTKMFEGPEQFFPEFLKTDNTKLYYVPNIQTAEKIAESIASGKTEVIQIRDVQEENGHCISPSITLITNVKRGD
jgi:hypothetical protein